MKRFFILIMCVTSAAYLGAIDLGGFDIHGFIDVRGGLRTNSDPHERDASLGEIRLQLFNETFTEIGTFAGRIDFIYDGVLDSSHIDLEQGLGPIDLREANALFSPLDSLDIKVGRQILTWGVGDMLFINDLFPKDWNALFSGRDSDYLKAPSDAILLSWFPGFVDVDLVYTPLFDRDRFISGNRLSYWNPMLGRRAGRDAISEPERRHDWFGDDEVALRLRRMIGTYELAVYSYRGYWKNPEGFDPVANRARYPRLMAHGASLRGALAGGVLSLETGYYDSKDDRRGRDPFTPNSQQRYLIGYERELMRDLQAGMQYYVEIMENYNRYRSTLPEGMNAKDEARHVLTFRLTKLAMNQNLSLSFFAFWSPSDHDAYIRPTVEYKATDDWVIGTGANIFVGRDKDSFFGQFEKNNNIYASVRWNF